MSYKRWTFTGYRDGKPVATEKHLSHDEALVALRAAVAGEDVRPVNRDHGIEPLSPLELGAAAFLARAA